MDLTVLVSRNPIDAFLSSQRGALPPFEEAITWVYIVCWRQRGPCKIGVAQHPDGRLRELQVASPYKLHVWRAYGVKSRRLAFEVEQGTLWLLRSVRLEGEWVDATVNQTSEAVMRSYVHLGIQPTIFDKATHGKPMSPSAFRKVRLKRWRKERAEKALAEYHDGS